jgi:phage gp36-like protein
MKFLTEEDYKAVVDGKTLEVIHQSDTQNLDRAEAYAIEEISGYLRAAQATKTGRPPYDVESAFAATGDKRNSQLVMYACDVALYHLIAWLPQRIGFEIREIRYKRAIEWLESVQAGTIILDLPTVQVPDGTEAEGSIRWGSWGQSKYEW